MSIRIEQCSALQTFPKSKSFLYPLKQLIFAILSNFTIVRCKNNPILHPLPQIFTDRFHHCPNQISSHFPQPPYMSNHQTLRYQWFNPLLNYQFSFLIRILYERIQLVSTSKNFFFTFRFALVNYQYRLLSRIAYERIQIFSLLFACVFCRPEKDG